MAMARTQTLVQLTDELLAVLDERAARERRSRSTLIREALEAYLHDEISAEVGQQIAEGYRRQPQTAEEDAWARANAVEASAGSSSPTRAVARRAFSPAKTRSPCCAT
jgi:predicted transcriptional regulator